MSANHEIPEQKKKRWHALGVVVIFTLIQVPLGWFFIQYRWLDSLLLLLLIPVLVCAMFYPRWVYLAMLAVAVLTGIWVTSQVAGDDRTTLITIFIVAISGILIAESLHALNRSRRQTVAALQESESKYRTLVEMLPHAILIIQDGAVVFANQSAAALAGLKRADELLGEKRPLGITDQDLALLDQYHLEHRREVPSTPMHREMSLCGANGESFPAEGIITIISYQGRQATQIVLQDISARKRDQTMMNELMERYRLISEVTSDFAYMASIGVDGEIVVEWGTDALARMTGYPVQELAQNMDLFALFHPEDQQVVSAHRKRILEGKPDNAELRLMTKDRREQWVQHSARPVIDSGTGRVERVFGAMRDITDRKLTEGARQILTQKRERLVEDLTNRRREDALLIELGDLLQSCLTSLEIYAAVGQIASRMFAGQRGGLFVLDSDRQLLESAITWGDPLVGDLIFAPGDCWALRRGRLHLYAPPGNRLSCPHVQRLDGWDDSVSEIDSPEEGVVGEVPPIVGGEKVEFPHLCMPLNAQGDLLGVLHLQLAEGQNPQDWSRVAAALAGRVALALANLKLRESLDIQAHYDYLTGLYNHAHVVNLLRQELNRSIRAGRIISVVLVDIDHFSSLNESHGRDAGDQVLREVGMMLKSSLDRDEIVGRFGGDGFILACPGASLEDTLERAERLRRAACNLQVKYRERVLAPLTISASVAGFPTHGEKLEEILYAAEVVLQRAKREGGNIVVMAE